MNLMLACPTRYAMVFGSIPAFNPSVTCVCRSPWTVILGTPILLTCWSNHHENVSGWIQLRSSRVKTRPELSQADAQVRALVRLLPLPGPQHGHGLGIDRHTAAPGLGLVHLLQPGLVRH